MKTNRVWAASGAASSSVAGMIHAADYLQTLLWHLNTLHHGPRIHHVPHQRLLDTPQYTIDTIYFFTKYTIYKDNIYEYIWLHLASGKIGALCFNCQQKILGLSHLEKFLGWINVWLIPAVWDEPSFPYQLITFDKHKFSITILNCSALSFYSRIRIRKPSSKKFQGLYYYTSE